MNMNKDYLSWLNVYGKESVLPDGGIIFAEGLNHTLTIYPDGKVKKTKTMKTNDCRYDCSMLRKHNWFKRTPYGISPFHKYAWIDTIRHIAKWINTGQYNWWSA